MRGHHFAYRLNQRRTERRAFFIQAAKWFPLNTPPPTGDLFAPLTPLQGEVPEERGHSGTSLSSRARSAVSRDDCRRFIRLNRALSLTFECGFSATQKLRFESQRAHTNHGCAPLCLVVFRYSGHCPQMRQTPACDDGFLPLLLGIFVRLFRHLAVFVQNRS